MRNVACVNVDCLNYNAPYVDDDPPRLIGPARPLFPCPVCGRAMEVVTLELVAARNDEKQAATRELELEQERAALAALPTVDVAPTAPPDASELARALVEAVTIAPDFAAAKANLIDVAARLADHPSKPEGG